MPEELDEDDRLELAELEDEELLDDVTEARLAETLCAYDADAETDDDIEDELEDDIEDELEDDIEDELEDEGLEETEELEDEEEEDDRLL
ncbi:hypothetical protein KCU65_g451, partial [Aureobasidium melanogenum]